MEKVKCVADVFIDTNILKFSAVKKYAYRKKVKKINWGDVEHEVEVHERFTINNLHQIKNDTQRRDAVFLGILAYAGISERLKFHIHREVDLEAWGLPGVFGGPGRFFGCPIHNVDDPVPPKARIIIGGQKTFKEHKLDFLGGIQHPRFIELAKMTGAYQGVDKPLNLNQGLDAYHIWCAECAGLKYFLTMDYKLQKVARKSKIKTSVVIMTPDQLLRAVLPKLGFKDAIKFLWKGYRFAKPRLGFEEGRGWR